MEASGNMMDNEDHACGNMINNSIRVDELKA